MATDYNSSHTGPEIDNLDSRVTTLNEKLDSLQTQLTTIESHLNSLTTLDFTSSYLETSGTWAPTAAGSNTVCSLSLSTGVWLVIGRVDTSWSGNTTTLIGVYTPDRNTYTRGQSNSGGGTQCISIVAGPCTVSGTTYAYEPNKGTYAVSLRAFRLSGGIS